MKETKRPHPCEDVFRVEGKKGALRQVQCHVGSQLGTGPQGNHIFTKKQLLVELKS